MTKKIFQSILLVAGCVLLASLLIIMGFLYDYFGGVEENQLRDELSLAAAAVEDGGTDYLSRLTADRYRLTWIAADGSVLYDTKTNAESLENHASRAEVSQALATGTGESTRYSSTLMEKTMYYAQRLDDGTVLRISISRATVGMIAVGMIQPLLIVLIVALILSGLLARRLSRRIVDPLNSLDLEHPLDNDAYEELSPLLKRIHHQHVEIQTQLRELREKTDEFTQITGSMREGLVLLDEHGSILSINAAAQALFGADAQCVGRDFSPSSAATRSAPPFRPPLRTATVRCAPSARATCISSISAASRPTGNSSARSFWPLTSRSRSLPSATAASSRRMSRTSSKRRCRASSAAPS